MKVLLWKTLFSLYRLLVTKGYCISIFLYLIYMLRRAKECLRACADSEGPDQPAHSRSQIRDFTVR